MSGTEVKDKKPLIEHRKLIEHEMERFKEVEKMMKTKAFSNEALASTNEVVDPRKKEKMECAEFIESNIEELKRQMEAIEAEIDQINSSMKKKKHDSAKQSQIEALQETLGRHKWHISMLESILRHLENDNLEVDQINEIKEDIEYYVESNEDPNFIEDDTFYDALGLDDMEDSFAVIPGDEDLQNPPSRSQSVSGDKEKERELEMEREKEKERERLKKIKEKEEKDRLKEKERKRLERVDKDMISEEKKQPLVSQLSQSFTNSPSLKAASLASTLAASANIATPNGTPKLNYASVAISGIKKPLTPAAVSYASLASSITNNNSSANSPSVQASNREMTSTPTSTNRHLSTQLNALSLNESQAKQVPAPLQETKPISEPTPLKDQEIQQDTVYKPQLSTPSTTLEYIENLASINSSRILQNSSSNNEPVHNIQEALSFLTAENYSNLPQGFEKYVEFFETAKNRLFSFRKPEQLHVPSKKSQPPPMICDINIPSYDEIKVYLENSLMNCPDSFDADKPRNYIPTNPHVAQPNFPIDPLPELINSTKTLEVVNIDTLFYIFYYNNLRIPSKFTNYHNLEANPSDDYLQVAAAKELNRRGWEYQASTNTWFQKDQEMGDGHYKSFDFKDTWMGRRNNNFKFNPNDIETGYFF